MNIGRWVLLITLILLIQSWWNVVSVWKTEFRWKEIYGGKRQVNYDRFGELELFIWKGRIYGKNKRIPDLTDMEGVLSWTPCQD